MRLCKGVVVLFVLLVLVSDAKCTLSKRDKKDKKSKSKDVPEELPAESVEERELVTSSPKWKEIVNNHNLYSSNQQHTRNMIDGTMVLGYVTPWNSHGYDIAKMFARKFTHISPVWLQLTRRYLCCSVSVGITQLVSPCGSIQA
jgi:chitinase domain-containing protein 1